MLGFGGRDASSACARNELIDSVVLDARLDTGVAERS